MPKSTDARSACRKVHVCHCNSLGGATWCSVTITGRTDRQTDRQSATHYAAPPREEGRIISLQLFPTLFDECSWSLINLRDWGKLFQTEELAIENALLLRLVQNTMFAIYSRWKWPEIETLWILWMWSEIKTMIRNILIAEVFQVYNPAHLTESAPGKWVSGAFLELIVLALQTDADKQLFLLPKSLGRLPKVDLIILEGGKMSVRPSVCPQKVSSISMKFGI